jgi:hypothetical protein
LLTQHFFFKRQNTSQQLPPEISTLLRKILTPKQKSLVISLTNEQPLQRRCIWFSSTKRWWCHTRKCPRFRLASKSNFRQNNLRDRKTFRNATKISNASALNASKTLINVVKFATGTAKQKSIKTKQNKKISSCDYIRRLRIQTIQT